jgi:hypothetical protein
MIVHSSFQMIAATVAIANDLGREQADSVRDAHSAQGYRIVRTVSMG